MMLGLVYIKILPLRQQKLSKGACETSTFFFFWRVDKICCHTELALQLPLPPGTATGTGTATR